MDCCRSSAGKAFETEGCMQVILEKAALVGRDLDNQLMPK